MTDEPAQPDFTFDPGQDPDMASLALLYARILGPESGKPTVTLGAISRADAETWLATQARRYADAVGRRSHLIKNMDLRKRVELVGLADAG